MASIKKVYKLNTTAGAMFSVGLFENGLHIGGGSPKYFKTKKGAEKYLSRLM